MKLRLVVESGSLAGRVFELEQGSFLLGRGSESALRFDGWIDPGVSTKHAMVHAEPDGFYLSDQQSTNGTYINGVAVKNARLNPGDLIQLGNQGPLIRVMIEAGLPSWPHRPPASPQAGGNDAAASKWREDAPTFRPSLRDSFSGIGVYNPDKERGRNFFGIGAVIGVGSVMAFLIMLLMIASVGFGGAIVGTVMAFMPAPFYLLLFLWLDRYDPEPAWALAAAFAWGALFAVLVSFIVNTVFGTVAAALVGGPAGDKLGAIISAPLIEEASKGLGVVLFLIFLRNEFDDVLDGIVYAGVIALGFATVENVLYYGRQYVDRGSSGLLFLAFLRGVLSPFAHSLFTSMTGIGCGIARETHNKALRIIMPAVGYLGAVFLHALWNGIASLFGGLFLIAYFVIWVPLFLIFMGVVFFMANREARIIKQMLAIEVARGLITQDQLELVGSSVNRWKWLSSTLGDWKRFKARRHFLRAVTKLAFCYWHVARAAEAHNQTRSLPQIPKFQAQVLELREQI